MVIAYPSSTMRYAGLFVGVDRQEDVGIEALSYAGRDAQAFWAAFADANEAEGHTDASDTTLLVGADATCASARAALRDLVERSNRCDYDLVTIHFSCHGTPDGRLILADTRVADLAAAALPVAEITAAFRDLKAGCVLAVFESCFSGVAAGWTPDGDDTSLRAIMQAFADGGDRIVVWAAGPSEEAYETSRLRHGLLTYALVTGGLYGTLGGRDGAIDIARWVNDAVHATEQQAARDGRHQRPGRINRLVGTPTIPRYLPGPRRRQQLAADQVHAVDADLSGLDAYGLSPGTIAAVRSRLLNGRREGADPKLTDLQQRAIAPGGALAGHSLLISGPTSCGKTLVGELAALVTAGRRLKTAVLLPMRALAAEKWEDFDRTYGPLGFRAVRSYGGAGDDDALVFNGHFDVGFFTYEKFWLLALTHPRLLDSLGLVVIDEAHMIADPGRGHVVELILTLLRLRHNEGFPTQVIALSAAAGDHRGLPTWLDAELVSESTRPVPLREAVVGPSGQASVRDSRATDTREDVAVLSHTVPPVGGRDPFGAQIRGKVAGAVVRAALHNGEQVLVFRAARYSTRALAHELALSLALEPCTEALDALGPEGGDESRASRELRACLQHGVAFHISDLDRAHQEAVEAAFRAGHLRVLVATSGLAMGVNLPANTVVIADHTRGPERITVAEYRNMAGRAGRWMGDIEFGTSYLIAANEADVEDLWQSFVTAESEPLVSQLAKRSPDDVALVLMVIRPGAITARELTARATSTFGGFQRHGDDAARRGAGEALERALLHLVELGLARVVPAAEGRQGPDRFELTPYGLVCGREGLRAESAARVLRGAEAIHDAGEPLNEIALIALAQVTCELDELYTPVEDTRRQEGQDELAAWHEQSQLTLGAQPAILTVLRTSADHDGRYLQRLKRLNAISMWVRGRPWDEIEDAFTLHVPEWKKANPEPASGAVRQAGERTADVLRAVGRLVALRFPDLADEIRERVVAMLPRLEHGVVREAAALMRLGWGIRRSDALRLIAEGIASPEALVDALERDDQALYPILTSEGVYRMRAMAGRRARQGSPRDAVEQRAATVRALFDRIGDATAL